MKIRILNNGGYGGFKGATFPFEVEGATPYASLLTGEVLGYDVPIPTLIEHGYAPVSGETITPYDTLYFSLCTNEECEEVIDTP